MRFAISTSPQQTSWPWLEEVWQRADQLEVFESGWTFDHFYPLFTDPSGDCFEGWVSLTALLAATERLRGGVLVTGMVYRHPAVLANMAVTLDHTSSGRLELGVGAGWFEEECTAYGIDLGTMSERFDRFAEGLEIITSLMVNDRTDFSGTYYELTQAMCNPKPLQSPLPICIGGAGRRRTIPLAARYADHWNYGSQTASVQDFAEARAVLVDECAARGRSIDDMTVSCVVRGNDLAALVEEAAAYEVAGAQVAIVSVPKHEPPAFVEQLASAAASLT